MSDPSARDDFDAVILAGGRGSRLGGVSKADLLVGGVRLLDRALAAVADARTRVVVGRAPVPDGVVTTLEEPAGSGPAAGLAAGLAAVAASAPWTVVLACDVGDPDAAVSALRAAADAGASRTAGYAMAAADGGPEWLAGIYDSAALRAAAAAYGAPQNRSVRGMLGALNPALVTADAARPGDIDTWADHARWNAYYRRRGRPVTTPTSHWQPFVDRACEALGVDAALVDIDGILDMTREIAHAGARPMAPVGAYLLGLAVGAGGDPAHLRRVLEDAASAAPLPADSTPTETTPADDSSEV